MSITRGTPVATVGIELGRVVLGAGVSGCSTGVTIVDQNQTHYRHRDNKIFLAVLTLTITVMIFVFHTFNNGEGT